MKTKVFFDGFEGHARRSLERAEKMSKGEPVEAQRIITFEDPLQMIECLTAQRIRLCQVVQRSDSAFPRWRKNWAAIGAR